MDLETPGTRETPRRFLRAMFESTAGYDGDFPIPASGRGLGYPISITLMTRNLPL